MVWSSAFVAGKLGLQHTDPYTLLTARFLLASVILLFMCLPTMKKQLFSDRTLLRDALLLGALNNALYLGLTFTALRYISPELVIIVVSCAPFLTSIIAGILASNELEFVSL
jgi:drug/metabolite transporter (DMT)-like permease